MRIYLMLRGKRTTISVEDQLIGYLADRVCRNPFERGFHWRKTTRKWIQKSIEGAGEELPEKNISQWVQARIIDAIVDPALLEKWNKAAQSASDEMPSLSCSA